MQFLCDTLRKNEKAQVLDEKSIRASKIEVFMGDSVPWFLLGSYTEKKISDFPGPSLDVTYLTLRAVINYGTGKSLTFFTVWGRWCRPSHFHSFLPPPLGKISEI
jgi:hypothetical protein